MSKNRLFFLVICALGLFFMAELTACTASRGFGCPTNLSKVEAPHHQVETSDLKS